MAENTVLALRNPHERDSHITFRDEGHIYTIDGDTGFMSVTTWNHRHFKPFDADKIIESMMARESWPNSRYFGKTPEQIKAGWEANRDAAAIAGTKLHYDIECYYNGWQQDNGTVEYQYFLNFAQKNAKQTRPGKDPPSLSPSLPPLSYLLCPSSLLLSPPPSSLGG